MPDEAAWRETQRVVVAAPTWVLDGNHATTYAERLPFADTVVVMEMDTPRWRCLARVLVRRLRRRGAELAPGCPDRVDLAFLRYVWRYPRRSRPRLEAAVAAPPPEVRVVRLGTAGGVRRFLAHCA